MIDLEQGLYGNETQRRLQASVLAAEQEIRETPGAVFAARMPGTDDPETFTWQRIEKTLHEEGAITFRMMPVDRCEEIEHRLAEIGAAITWWDVFDGPKEDIGAACEKVLDRSQTEFQESAPSPAEASAFFERVQAFMQSCGVAPFPARILAGETGSVALSVLTDSADGSIAATSFSYLPYNRFSPYHDNAWAGLVAVRDDFRRKGIGAYVNALTLKKAVTELGAARVQEYARTSNVASCKMIERCGLKLNKTVRSGIAQPKGAASFTR